MKGEGDMQADAQRRRLTYDDFLLLPDDGMRHELIDGEHYVTPSPNLRHQELVGRLHFDIELYLRQNAGRGRVFVAPLDVVFTRWDVVEPDLLFVSDDQNGILTTNNEQGGAVPRDRGPLAEHAPDRRARQAATARARRCA